MLMFFLGMLTGAVVLFLGLYGLARFIRKDGDVSTVTKIHPNGERTVEKATRKRQPSEVPDVEENVGGENSRQVVGESVHAVLRQGQA